ncbi:hypothetical protein [Curtobacterium sp. L1-20]|uniref:hypothetical protein n=1 Tax=Curtobacterium sp. L1-20 TaxID=3138181 RepID=UPI003B52CECA
MNTNDQTPKRGRAFRRAGSAVLVAGAAACAAAALFGTLPAQASVAHHAAPAAKTTTSHVAAATAKKPVSIADVASARTPAEKQALIKQLRAQLANDPTQKALDAYAKAGYKYEDSLNLATIWKTDRTTAKSTAGSKLLAGHELPFAPGQGFSRTYTSDQDLYALGLVDPSDPGLADRLAQHWHVSPAAAKVKAGSLALANKPIPLEQPTPTEADAQNAFTAAGYDYAYATKLAKYWHVDPTTAKAKAGWDLLASPKVALPVQP